MTPYEIRLLLHLFCIAEKPEWTPILEDTLKKFVLDGLIKIDLQPYELTQRGEAYCRALQQMPLPIEQRRWIVPDWELKP